MVRLFSKSPADQSSSPSTKINTVASRDAAGHLHFNAFVGFPKYAPVPSWMKSRQVLKEKWLALFHRHRCCIFQPVRFQRQRRFPWPICSCCCGLSTEREVFQSCSAVPVRVTKMSSHFKRFSGERKYSMHLKHFLGKYLYVNEDN